MSRQAVDVARDVELALARQAAVVDRLVDRVGHVLALPVAQLDPGEVLERDAPQLLGRDAELAHVPRVDRDARRSARRRPPRPRSRRRASGRSGRTA